MTILCNICCKEKDVVEFYGKSFRQCKECVRKKDRERKRLCRPSPEEQERIRQYRKEKYLSEKASRKAAREARRGLPLALARRLAYYKKTYNLSADAYKHLYDTQKEKCAICHKRELLLVDHCHRTGKVRGLLCNSCNTALGFLRDDPSIAREASLYLERNKQNLRDSTNSSGENK